MADQTSTVVRAADAAGDRAAELGTDAADLARTVAASARDHGAALGHEATQRMGSLWDQAEDEMRRQVDSQAERLQSTLQGWADEVRALGDGRVDEAPTLRSYVERLADTLEQAARRLDEGGVEGQLNDLRRFARRRPAAFLFGATLVGFGVGRLVRGRRDAQSSGQSPAASSGRLQGSPSTGRLGTGSANGMHDPVVASYAAVGGAAYGTADEIPGDPWLTAERTPGDLGMQPSNGAGTVREPGDGLA